MNHFCKKVLLGTLCVFCLAATATGFATPKNDKALVVVSFGTTFDETREKDIGGIETALASAFPNRDVKRAFTSNIIMKRLGDRKIHIDNLDATLTKLKKEGYKDVLIQPTHLLHGEEFELKIVPTVNKHKDAFSRIILSDPLMVNDFDINIAASAVATQFPVLQKGEGIILMGHGSPRDNNKSFKNTYPKLQAAFDKMDLPVVVGVVEEDDTPNLEEALELLKKRGYKKVYMYPLMLVAGDHAANDMYSDEDDSWKVHIEKMGIKTDGFLQGIGRNAAVQALYIQHAIAAESGITR